MSDNEPVSLRDTIEASFNSVESGSTKDTTPAPEITNDPTPDSTQASTDSAVTIKDRDEKGRFAAQQTEKSAETAPNPSTTAPTPAETAPAIAPVATEEQVQRPTTWKKEYMPAWEKMARGEALTPEESKKLAQYNVQREREFSTGVSTYRAEAQNAKHLTDALAPFMPTIQGRGMTQASFVESLGKTYHFLVNGQPQEKMAALSALARNVGIPLEAVMQQQGGNIDPVVPQLMEYIQNLEHKVNNVSNWREQQVDASARAEINKFNDESKYPHFKEVSYAMGRLIEGGFAQDTDTAYQMAVRMNNDTWQAEQARQAPLYAPPVPQIDKVAEAAAARAKMVSVSSSAPVGKVKVTDPTDLRSMLDAAFDTHAGHARV